VVPDSVIGVGTHRGVRRRGERVWVAPEAAGVDEVGVVVEIAEPAGSAGAVVPVACDVLFRSRFVDLGNLLLTLETQ